jgi:DNA-binding FadR family transcriptional regulator
VASRGLAYVALAWYTIGTDSIHVIHYTHLILRIPEVIMLRDRSLPPLLQYIVDQGLRAEEEEASLKLLPMGELCQELGVSRGKAREELIAAQAWGVVEMRPGDGTYVRPLDFYTPIRTLLLYGVMLDKENFSRYYELRVKLEVAFWDSATCGLTSDDLEELGRIVESAEKKLGGHPVEIPHWEHRQFHLRIFARLDNEFVLGLLRAYWDAYEAVGLHMYFDYRYYEDMWSSHRAMLNSIVVGQYDEGREALIQHFGLLGDRLQGERERG